MPDVGGFGSEGGFVEEVSINIDEDPRISDSKLKGFIVTSMGSALVA